MQSQTEELLIDTALLNKARMTIRAIDHSLRQQMILLIHSNARMTVTEIYVRLRLEQSVTSQHLGILRKERFLLTERSGKYIFYSVNYQRIRQVQTIARDILSLLQTPRE